MRTRIVMAVVGLGVAGMMASGCGPGTGGAVAELSLGGASTGLTVLGLDDTRVGATSRATLTIANVGDAATGAIAVDVTGAAFAVDPASTCGGATLAPDDTCTIVVAFTPRATGAAHGSLAVTAAPGGTITLELAGAGLAPALAIAPATIDFGDVGPGDHDAVATITNGATEAVAIDAVTVDGTAFTHTSACGSSLAAGASCDVTITLHGVALGAATGTLSVTGAGAVSSAPIHAVVGGELHVTRVGPGTVSGGGIACGATCDAIATAPVTLTATPDGGAIFVGWSEGACGTQPTCQLAPTITPRAITATFATSGGAALTVSFAGAASGEVIVSQGVDAPTVCHATCTVPITAGTPLTVTAITPSVFQGFAGACTTTAGDCTFTPTASAALTATFARGAGEVDAALLTASIVRSVDVASADRLVIGTDAGVIALADDLSPRWAVTTAPDAAGTATIALDGPARVAPDDGVVVATGTSLVALAADGAWRWTRALGATAIADPYAMAHTFAIAPNGDIAIQIGNELRVFDSAGQARWSATVGPGVRGAVAIGPDGEICTAIEDLSGEGSRPQCFDPAGASVASPDRIAYQYRTAFAIDAQHRFVASSSGHSDVYVQRTTAAGAAAGLSTTAITDPDFVENGLALDPAGGLASVHHADENTSPADGFVLRHFDDAFAVTYTTSRAGARCDACALGVVGPDARDLAVDTQGRITVVGAFLGSERSAGLIQRFAP